MMNAPMPWCYQIRVNGHLDPSWSDWFDGLTISHDADGSTTIRGPVVDQAALYGLISRARDLGLILLAVKRGTADGSGEIASASPFTAPEGH